MITKSNAIKNYYKPLEKVEINTDGNGYITVFDGEGKMYFGTQARPTLSFTAAGALGTHWVRQENDEGTIIDQFKIKVDCETEIIDEGGEYQTLLEMLKYTMVRFGEHHDIFLNNKTYKFFVCWVRDHVHTMKGMKYFDADLKTAMDLFRFTQREDGMIWDNYHFHEDKKWCYWESRFEYGEFMRLSPDKSLEFKRIPVENDVEYLYVEGIYYTWKAVGDDGWMSEFLDSAIKAFDYSVNTKYRWSEKFNLLKRGYTIDTWDFQSSFDVERSGDAMGIDFDKTEFNIMHGDNTGFSASCRYLAEMLEYVGRTEEAAKFFKLSKDVKDRLDKVSWNGSFYTHQVPENPSVVRDFGVDTSKQFSLSNAYALNRGLTHEQCVAIIKEYQNLKNNLPEGSKGEWYTIYPPFQAGFSGHNGLWEYMNGGVITIVGGELCRGAFENGFEEYGVDILQRMSVLAKEYDGFLNVCFRGANEKSPKRAFTPVDLSAVANTDFYGAGANGVPGWTGEGENDFHTMPVGPQVFEEVPFEIVDPAKNGRKAAIGLSSKAGYCLDASITVNALAKSVYFVHTMAGAPYAGEISLVYEDGSDFKKYVNLGADVVVWWTPEIKKSKRSGILRIAWEGTNAVCGRIGAGILGVDNPNPDKKIVRIDLKGAENGNFWAVLGVTLSDSPVYFKPSEVSFGIPENWGAAAVVYGLIEGLCGVVDRSAAFDKITVSPRWAATGVKDTKVYVKYPASNAYVAYEYLLSEDGKKISLHASGNSSSYKFHCLLPDSFSGNIAVEWHSRNVEHQITTIQDKRYVDFEVGASAQIKIEIIQK